MIILGTAYNATFEVMALTAMSSAKVSYGASSNIKGSPSLAPLQPFDHHINIGRDDEAVNAEGDEVKVP